MTRVSPLAGPGGLMTVLALAWFTAVGVTLAWLASSYGTSSAGELLATLSRLLPGGSAH